MDKTTRPLLPAPERPPEPGPSQDVVRSQANRTLFKRRSIAIACNNCRSKKAACDGDRPKCGRCTRNSITCIYTLGKEEQSQAIKSEVDALQRNLKEHSEILNKLRSGSDEDALEIVKQLRRSSNISMVLASAEGSASTTDRPSDLRNTRSILPPTYSKLEFELAMLHDKMYSVLEPIDVSTLDINKLVENAPRNCPEGWSSATESTEISSLNWDLPELSPWGIGLGAPSPTPGALYASGYCDERLRYLNIGYWTTTPISDVLAARTISMYLVNDHPILGHFDADLFLADLVNGQLEYCSPFLVCSLLYLTCQSYASVDINAVRFTPSLFIEAERLWKAERLQDSTTTLAAMMVFAFACTMSGKESIVFELYKEVREMAPRLKAFGIPPTKAMAEEFHEMPPKRLRDISHVAWGAYNWLSTHAMFFLEEPIAFPPALPIPGDSTTYPSMLYWPPHPLPEYMGQTFKHLSKYCVIVQEVAAVYLVDGNTTVPERVSLALAEAKYQKMLDWADSLPRELALTEDSPGHVLLLHGLFHGMVLDIFRPFSLRQTSHQRLKSFNSPDSNPSTVTYASCCQLKRILYLYMSQLQPTLYCPVLSAPVLQLTHCLLRSFSIPDWRFYFFLCINWLKIMTVRYPIFAVVARAHLTMAMKDGMITSAEAYQLMDEVNQSGSHHDGALNEAVTTCVVDFNLAMSDPDEAKVHQMAQRFDEFAVFGTFIEGEFSGLEGQFNSKGESALLSLEE